MISRVPPMKTPAHDGHKGLRRFIAADLAALSVATGALSAAPAVAAVPDVDTGARLELALADGCPSRPASTRPEDVRAWQRTVVDGMLARGAAVTGRALSADQARRVRDDAMRLPPPVISVLEQARTGVTVIPSGQSPIDVGVEKPYDATAAFTNVGALRETVDAAWAKAEVAHGPAIARIDAQLAPLLDVTSREDRSAEQVVRRDTLLAHRGGLVSKRNFSFYRDVMDQTDGRVEAHQIIGSDRDPELILALEEIASAQPVTLDELAAQHGARTAEERDRIISLVRALNGERLTAAQNRFARLPQDLRYHRPPSDGLTETARPFMAQEDGIVVPAIYYQRDSADPSAPPRVFKGRDLLSSSFWHTGAVSGEFITSRDGGMVMLSESHLQTDVGERSTLVHEMGHAFEDAVRRLDAPTHARFVSQRDESFWRNATGKGHFVSEYAATNPNEMAADTFAYRFSGDAARMQRVDPVWRAQLDGFIADGSRLGEACLQPVATRGEASALGAAPLVLAQASVAPEGRVYQRGVASWYGPGFDGLPTASGERFNRRALTAAHPTLPLGSRAQIINLGNGRSVDVVVNDRGPYVRGRVIDLSQGAAEQLGFTEAGTARVEIRLRY